jgi:hypothetical protein
MKPLFTQPRSGPVKIGEGLKANSALIFMMNADQA